VALIGDFYMGCLAEVLASSNDVRYKYGKEAQKYIIEFLLTYSCYDLKSLAEILNCKCSLLSLVLSGKDYLDEKTAIELFNWFFLFINA